MSEKPIVEFWFDLASTYSYLAAHRVDDVAARFGVWVEWKPVFLGGVFKALGQPLDSPFNINPVKGNYMWRELERQCDQQGLPLTIPQPFPQNSIQALRIVCVGRNQPWMKPFVLEAYKAQFSGLIDLADTAALDVLLARAGAPAKEVLSALSNPDVKQELRMLTDEALEKRLFGAPTFYTPDGEMFWGNDRMEQAFSWATRGERFGTKL